MASSYPDGSKVAAASAATATGPSSGLGHGHHGHGQGPCSRATSGGVRALDAAASGAVQAGSLRSGSLLPSAVRTRLGSLFRDLEKEFEVLYLENVRLRERLRALEKGQHGEVEDKTLIDDHDAFESMLKAFAKTKAFKTRTKIKAHTNKIVSSFKPASLTCTLVKEFKGHKDGIWDISVAKKGDNLVGTASADRTARIWSTESGRCLAVYSGHTGSVNAIAFHPTKDLALTVSGDGTGQVWSSCLNSATLSSDPAQPAVVAANLSSDDSPESSDEDAYFMLTQSQQLQKASSGLSRKPRTIRAPVTTLVGHQGVVISCQWLDDTLAVTAGWDRSANLYSVETGVMIHSLMGHDSELTHVSCHPTQRLVTTCSTDSTFRLWDFREPIHSVSVFQGHTDSVSCAQFTRSDQVVSGSDDRSVKVWDLRNMRSPMTSIQTQSAVNRLDISASGLIAIPQDNRHVAIHDLSGQKLSRLPRDSSKSHRRMVTAVCWSAQEDLAASIGSSKQSSSSSIYKANLFSAGFDRLSLGWSVKAAVKDDLNN